MLTECQKKVFNTVLKTGALTSRRITAQYGPKPNWQALILQKYLTEYQTDYGAVLALGSRARTYLRENPQRTHYPYIAGPSTVADRAYQNDALKVLTDQGYQVHHHDYKRAGAVGQAARQGRDTTDQILRTVMQLPPARLAMLQGTWGDEGIYRADQWGIYPQVVGYPLVYASIANGGIKLPKLKALFKRHLRDIHCWRTPLLIAVPEEGNLRAYIRAEETRNRRELEEGMKAGRLRDLPIYSLIKLIILPLP